MRVSSTVICKSLTSVCSILKSNVTGIIPKLPHLTLCLPSIILSMVSFRTPSDRPSSSYGVSSTYTVVP